jgi:Fe(3+) dicitrate transport protein
LASGGSGTGDLFNGGDVNVGGLEASARFAWAPVADWSLPVRASYTYTRATFQDDFISDYQPWGRVDAGDRLPYLPEHQLSAAVGVERRRWRADIEATFNGAMRTSASQGPIDPLRDIEGFLVWDFSADATVSDAITVFVAVENLTDNRYIVARRPAGARPGLPRTALIGARLDF